MKLFIKILLLSSLVPALASAQSNYKPGYVVNLKGDTLRGFIDYQEWDFNPDAINFKKTIADQVSKYGASDIAAFGIDKLESYIKYTGPISTDLTDPNKAASEDERDTSFRVGTVFLKVLEKGNKVALYSYKDELKIRFYIGGTPDYKPVELVYRITRVSTEYTYRKQLSTTAYKYNELTDNIIAQIGRLEYYESDILDIVSKINHIDKTEYAKSQYSGPAFNFFAGAGVNVNTTSPSSEGSFYAAGGRSYTSFRPAVMLGLNLFANPATRKLQLSLELSEAQSGFKSLYTNKVYPYQPFEASYNEMALSASFQIIYNFYNTENFKVFGGAGFALSHYSFSNAYLGPQNHGPSQSQIIQPYYFISQDNSFIIKGGVQFTRHLVVFIEYQSTVTPTYSDYFDLSSACERVGLNYIFK
jgi:hypothetical protein